MQSSQSGHELSTREEGKEGQCGYSTVSKGQEVQTRKERGMEINPDFTFSAKGGIKGFEAKEWHNLNNA